MKDLLCSVSGRKQGINNLTAEYFSRKTSFIVIEEKVVSGEKTRRQVPEPSVPNSSDVQPPRLLLMGKSTHD
jgi:hypothetical protein